MVIFTYEFMGDEDAVEDTKSTLPGDIAVGFVLQDKSSE
jgi:hypothetical protein